MKILLSGLIAFCACGADFTSSANFRVQTTPRSAVICYTVPSSGAGTAGTWEISESPSYTPLVYDVDASLFANSNSDSRAGSQSAGRSRCFVAGEGGTGVQYAPAAPDGKRYSRAFRPVTTYYARLTVGADTATLSFLTANIAPGDSYPVATPTDPSAPGVSAWPTVDPMDRSKCYNNPITGICAQVFALGDFIESGSANIVFHHQYQATDWTNPGNILAPDGSVAVTSSTNPIVVTTDTKDSGDGLLGGLTLYVKGYVDDACAVGDDRKASAALTVDGVNAYGPFIDVILPAQTAYGAGVETPVGDADPNPVPFIKAWLNLGQAQPRAEYLNPRSGNYTRSGADLTMNWSGSTNAFDQNWVSGSHIVLDSSGTPAETTIASVTSGTAVTVMAGSGPVTANWTGPNFGFILKKKTASCSMSIDYVHVVRNRYGAAFLNNGSGSSRQAPYRRYPQGWRVTGCTNAAPIVCTTGTAVHDISAGNVVKVAKVLGNTAANGTFTVSSAGGSTFTLSGSTGNGAFAGDGIVTKVTPAAATGYVFQAGHNNGGLELYWWNPDTTPSTIAALGQQRAVDAAFGGSGLSMDNYALDDSDPDAIGFWISIIPSADPTKNHLYKGVYLGSPSLGLFRDMGSRYDGVDWRWTDTTPAPNAFSDQLTAFDAASAGVNIVPVGLQDSSTLVLTGRLGSQNTLGWIGAWDVVNNRVKGLTNSWSSPDSRFCGVHNTSATNFGAHAILSTFYPLNSDNGAHSGFFVMTATNSGLNTATPSDCQTLLTGLGLSNPRNITGSKCSSVTVDTTTPVTTGTPGGETIGPVAVGDVIYVLTAGLAESGEDMRIVGIGGTTLVVERQIWGLSSPVVHPSGSKLSVECSAVPNTMIPGHAWRPYSAQESWWDYVNDPHGTNTADPWQLQLPNATNFVDNLAADSGHNAGRGDFTAIDGSAWPLASYIGAGKPGCPRPAMGQARWVRYGDYKSVIAQCHETNPAFDGSGGNGFVNVETHPAAGAVTGTETNTHIIDARPHQNSAAWQQTVAKVAGKTYIYKVTAYDQDGNTYDYKRQGLTVWSGHRAMRDVSAAGFDYAAHDDTGDAYTYCRAYKNDDCLTGSAANDVYVNVPKAAQAPAGFPFGTGYRCLGAYASVNDLDDICVAIAPTHGNYIAQYEMNAASHDGFGLGSRRIANPFYAPKEMEFTNLNTNELPDGSWTAISYLAFKLPPYPGRSAVNRTSWIPVPVKVTSVPPGTDNVIVEFGYGPNFYCSSRQEVCVANASTIQPGSSVFSYATSDTYSGLSCASGCTVAIPALSQRVMWYQIDYRNTSGQTILTRKAEPLVTP